MSSMIQTDASSVVRAKKAGAEQYNRRADGTPRPWYSTAIARVVMIALSLLFLLPLYWMIASALKSDEELAQEGDATYTWSGGQCLVIPAGANITRTLWEFLKFYAGFQGQSTVVPQFGNLPTNLRAIEEGTYNPKAELFRQMLPNSTSRPPLPVGSAMWDTLTRARSSVALGSRSPAAAVADNQSMIAPKMDLFEGYRMPDTYGQPSPVPGS